MTRLIVGVIQLKIGITSYLTIFKTLRHLLTSSKNSNCSDKNG